MLEVVKKLVAAGALLDARNKEGSTALMEAMRYSNDDVANYLIESGADVNITDVRGDTALILAEGGGMLLEVVKKLVEAGANIDATNKEGRTALMEALRDYKEDVAYYLIESGADIKASDIHDNTALTIAAEKVRSGSGYHYNGMKKVFQLLLHLDNEEVDEEGGVINASSAKTMKKLYSIFN